MAAIAEQIKPLPAVNPWLIAVTVMLATFMEVLDTSVANVSLPHIAGSLSAGVDESTWVLTSYLVSNAIVLPLTGWFSSLFGRKRFYMACVIIFTLSSLLCGFAPSLPLLVIFRVIQGAGGGGLQPISQAILVDSFPRDKQGMAMAVYGMGVVVAPTIGPTLGGWITDNFSWRWIFFLNVPVGILSLLMTSVLIIDPPHIIRKTFKDGLKIDFLGLGLLAVGLGFLQIVFDKGERDDWFGSRFITWATVIAVVCLVALVIWELKIDHPVIELRLLKERNFVISTFMMFILGLVLYGTTVLLPILLQTLMGYTAMQSGLVLLPGGLVLLLVLPLVGWLLSRFEPRWLVVFGFVIIAIGLFQLAHMNLDVSERTPVYDWIVSRAGTAFLFVPINVMAFYFVAKENTNNATGLINLARNVGGSLGISFVTTMLDRRAQFHQARLVSNLQSKNLQYQGALNHLIHVFMSRGADAAHAAVQAQGVIYAQLQRQAMMLSFTDNFWIMAMLSLVVIPLMFIMKKIKPRKTSMAAH
ncbi:MAG TPA: DHA2 family efflux MFS transporter permease subunit [Candidatus Acidoferrales bacterium]|nr:DHA2 family efflux MFS transporter permease subunit [Candidatus Acidoferrales bacterium]